MTGVQKTTRDSPKLVYTGVAAEDIEPQSIILKVICPELLPGTTSGTVGAGITTANTKLKDRDGNPISSPITTSNHIVATWERESGQRYPGLVRAGEPVEIFKRADQDKYYWRTTGEGRDFRKTDRVVFEIGASDPTKPGQEKDDTNTYTGGMDSESKKVWMKTSKANGEVSAFSMEFDLAEGTFHISDDSESPGNRIFLDTGTKSGVPTFQVNLTSGIVMKFEKDNGFIKIPKKFEIDAGERIVMNSPITVFNLNQTGAFIINATSVAINGSKDIVLKAGAIGLNGATKISGILKAATAVLANALKGSVSGSYSGVSVSRPQESPVTNTSNSPDTSSDGIPYKTS